MFPCFFILNIMSLLRLESGEEYFAPRGFRLAGTGVKLVRSQSNVFHKRAAHPNEWPTLTRISTSIALFHNALTNSSLINSK